jgi:hopene-associated glycosyltransferase HpnB
MTFLIVLSLLGWLYLASGHGAFWKPLVMDRSPDPTIWPSVDIIVPARDEADSLPQTLPSLLRQDYAGAWRVVLADDHSGDGTSEAARRLAAASGQAERLTVIAAPDLPAGWSGKVAAMQAGVAQSRADYILFTDADIEHPIDSLRRLMARAVARKLDLVSLMVRLHCVGTAEKFLIPSFVFFFAMIYPFRSVNDWQSGVAAAAGGAMLVRRRALDNAGGLKAIKSSLIDDCALAKIIKYYGGDASTTGRIELGLSEDAKSLRAYPALGDLWSMIARSAFAQLNHSPWLLAATVVGMVDLFLMPVVALLAGGALAAAAGFAAWLTMSLLYLPTIRFYRLPPAFALTLPVAGLIYIGATIDSLRLFRQGKGGQWKGRTAISKAR